MVSRVWHYSASGVEASVLELWGMWSHLFIVIASRSKVVVPVSLIYGSNRPVWKLLVFDRNTWNHVSVGK